MISGAFAGRSSSRSGLMKLTKKFANSPQMLQASFTDGQLILAEIASLVDSVIAE
jgi:hypothetical protein